MPISEQDRIAWSNTKKRRNPSGKGQAALSSMILAPSEVQELFLFLEQHEDEIRALGDAHAADVKRL